MFHGREKDLVAQATENPQEFFKCNKDWPLCRFNYMQPHSVADEFVFKTPKLPTIYQDYFSPEKMGTRVKKDPAPTVASDVLI